MFDISLGELLVVVACAAIFLSPDDFPKVIKTLAKALKWIKKTSREITNIFDNVADDSGISEIKKEFEFKKTLIKGDDDKYYEAYETTDVLGNKNKEAEKNGNS